MERFGQADVTKLRPGSLDLDELTSYMLGLRRRLVSDQSLLDALAEFLLCLVSVYRP